MEYKPKYAFFIFLFLGMNWMQSYAQQPSAEQKLKLDQMLMNLYEFSPDLSYNISTEHIKSDFSKINTPIKYDKPYFYSIIETYSEDTINPISSYKIAQYYSENQTQDKAIYYYQKSLKNLAISYFDADSAAYYSFRGSVKMALGDSSGKKDFESSLRINPQDTLAVHFYPLLLFEEGNFTMAKSKIERLLNAQNTEVATYFLYYAMADMFEYLQTIMLEVEQDKDLKASYAQSNVADLYDFSTINHIAEKHPEDYEIQNARTLLEVFVLISKIILFEQDENRIPVFSYTEKDKESIRQSIAKLEQLNQHNNINPYSFHNATGVCFLLLNEYEKAQFHLEKATDVFPLEKEGGEFSINDAISAQIWWYYLQQKEAELQAFLIQRIEATESPQEKVQILQLLLRFALSKNDFEKANSFAEEAFSLDNYNFETLGMLALINLKLDRFQLFQRYAQSAQEQAKTDLQNYEIGKQLCLSQAYLGDFKVAKSNIQLIEASFGAENCDFCQALKEIMAGK